MMKKRNEKNTSVLSHTLRRSCHAQKTDVTTKLEPFWTWIYQLKWYKQVTNQKTTYSNVHEGNNICKTFFCRIDRDTITPLSQLGQQPNDFSLQRRTISLSVELDRLTDWLCPSLLRRWSISLLVGFTDPYNYTYSERQWQRQRQRQYIFEILMTHSFQIWW